jgi:capsid protein
MFAPANETQLADVRRQCRLLALENEFAINGHENRISYIVGPGHNYRATVRKGQAAPAELVAEVQRAIDEFIELNSWHRRQQEIVRRRDRDGEAFLRFFPGRDGTLRVRFVEPDQIVTPPSQAANPAARLGILTDRDDVETTRGYFIDGRLIDTAEIQHRKANVDANVRRGLPLFYPVRKNLRRAEKLLRNMSVVAEIQSAIALIRKHRQGTAAGVQQFASNQADGATPTATAKGRSTPVRRYAPGTILDTHASIEYDFPATGIDASAYVTVLQAELRAIASRLVMPEFMLTSDASNSNYASTMVAEGPAMRMFERLQAEQVRDDLHVMWRAVGAAIDAGLLPAETRRTIDIQAAPPSPCMRDQLKDAHRHKIEHAAGILSPQTWSQLAGLDYDQEQANLAAHVGESAAADSRALNPSTLTNPRS